MASLAEHIAQNFSNPSDGDTFIWGGVRYTYDATPGIWTGAIPEPEAIEGAATSMEAPSQPVEGDLWYDGVSLRIRTNNEWIEASPQPTAEDLGVMSDLFIFSEDSTEAVATETTSLRFTSNTGDEGALSVTGTAGQATVAITFPTIPDVMSVPSSGSGVQENYVSGRDQDGNLTNMPLAMATAGEAGGVSLENLNNISTEAPAQGEILTYNATSEQWEPAAAPAGGSTVTIDSEGNTITIAGNSTEIPVITNAAIVGQNFVISRNGSAGDFTIPISQFMVDGGGDADTSNFNLVVDGNENINTINFTGSGAMVGLTTDGVIEVNVPENPMIRVEDDGVSRASNLTNMNFTGDGVTVTNSGAGRVIVDIPGGSGGGGTTTTTNTMTALTNVDIQGNLFAATEQPTGAARSNLSITGSVNGGSKHRILVKNNSGGSRNIQWFSNGTLGNDPADNINALVMTGSRNWGLWRPQNGTILVVREGERHASFQWAATNQLAMQAYEVIYFDIDLPPNGNFTLNNNGSLDTFYWHTTLTADDAALVEVDVPEDTPAPDTSMPDTFGGEVDPGWTGVFNNPGTEANDDGTTLESTAVAPSLTWRDDNTAAYARLSYDPIVGGDGDSSSSSQNGNDRWGTNPNREPAGIWMEAQGANFNRATEPRIYGYSILLPHEGDDEALTYLREHSQNQLDWNSHPVYAFNSKTNLQRSFSGLISGGGTNLRLLDTGGFRMGIHNAAGVNRGPFSDQFMITAGSRNWSLLGIPIGSSESIDSVLLDQVHTLAFNVPGDPNNAVLQVRRRGTFAEDNSTQLTAYMAVPAAAASSGIGAGNGVAANTVVFAFPADQFSSTEGPGSGNRIQFNNFLLAVRRLCGSQIILPDGVSITNRTISQVLRVNGNPNGAENYGNITPLGGAFWAQFRFEAADPTLTGAASNLAGTFQGDLDSIPSGTGVSWSGVPSNVRTSVTLTTHNNLRGPVMFQRQDPLEIVTDATNSNAKARLWQVEYRLIR